MFGFDPKLVHEYWRGNRLATGAGYITGKKGEEREFKAEESDTEQMVNSQIDFGL